MKKLNRCFSPLLNAFLFLTCLTPLSISAQLYGTAAGVRIGSGLGLTVQQQVAPHTTVEGILQSNFSTKDVTVTVLGEQHQGILRRTINVYFGAGLYKTWLETDANLKVQPTDPWGLGLVTGIELTLGKLNLSADIKPAIKFAGDGKAIQAPIGISARYVFASRYFKDESWKFWKKWQKKK